MRGAAIKSGGSAGRMHAGAPPAVRSDHAARGSDRAIAQRWRPHHRTL